MVDINVKDDLIEIYRILEAADKFIADTSFSARFNIAKAQKKILEHIEIEDLNDPHEC